MRLLFTIPDFWPHVRRGSERLVHDLGAILAARGHRVTVVTRTPGDRATHRRDSGMSVRYRPLHPRLLDRAGWTPLEGFAVTAAGASLLRRADVCHAFYLTDAAGMVRARRLHRRPVVLSLHGPPGRAWWEREHPRTHRWFATTLRRLDRVTVLSEDSARRLRADYGVDPLVLVPGIVTADFALPRPAPEARTIACAAAVDDGRKRLDVLLDAFALVAREEPDVRLLLLGHGDPGAIVAPRLAALPASVRARVEHRPVPTEELPRIYSGCTVGALASDMEAFGLVLVEHLAAGMPVVASDSGGSPEIVTADTGAVFHAGDADDCAQALRRALALAAQPGSVARCRARAAAFDWSARIGAFERLYRELAA